MAQVLVLYNTPADPAAFDRYYHQTHIPLAQKMPGLRSYVISNGPVQALAGIAPHLVAILHFDSLADLNAWISRRAGCSEAKITMTVAPRNPTTHMERRIESALAPGRFVSYNVNFEFVRELESAEKQIARMLLTEPGRAAPLYESFLAGCYEKAEEIDDSSGSFGQFIGKLFCGWIKARQAACADSDDTAARLLVWMDNDPYGFCYQLERNAAKVLDKAGLTAFEKLIRARFEAAGGRHHRFLGNRRGVTLITGPGARARCSGRFTLTKRMSKPTPRSVRQPSSRQRTVTLWQRCSLLAASPRTPSLGWSGASASRAQAVRWEAKTSLDSSVSSLRSLGAGQPRGSGRSFASYDDLMKYVPRAERTTWHKNAIEGAMGTDLRSLMQLLLETEELGRLAKLVGESKDSALEGVSHHTTEPAAKKLQKTFPAIAARPWRAQGMRIINAKKNKYYNAALENFEQARRCYERAGLAADWRCVVNEVRAEHRRKTGFMLSFDEVVAGLDPSKKRSFLERENVLGYGTG